MTATSGKSYFDCVNIYPEDEVSIASDGALVRTAVISFVGEYWNQTLSRSQADASTTSEKEDEKKEKEEEDGPISILFVDPSVVQAMVTFGDASIGPMHEMRRASILVFPITTHVGEGGGGDNNGGHWSLVVVVANRRSPPPPSSSSPLQFFCIDSSGRYNERPSKGLVRLLLASSSELGWPSPLLPGKNVTTSSMNKGSSPPPPLQYVTSFPQQETAYDCGVMVCLALQRMGQVCRGGAAISSTRDGLRLRRDGVPRIATDGSSLPRRCSWSCHQ
ncbi:peptidase, putative [Bodo saltans]|uniref:Peptidase, putative n=1 Tax=Bodo saltans TaxID=75058 RepID=A0A0S4IMV6_BODSA|nr:peptidase, putative [Bodo saltans]|eukprot:CUE75663.1 peptidase, putative [Bodo saltans]